jgi:hypothetical protein
MGSSSHVHDVFRDYGNGNRNLNGNREACFRFVSLYVYDKKTNLHQLLPVIDGRRRAVKSVLRMKMPA